MNLHEYQAKQLFAEYGLPVSKGYAVSSVEEALVAADKIGGDTWVVKAQVHAGGRGKAGGVKLVKTKDEIADFCRKMLGTHLVTDFVRCHQCFFDTADRVAFRIG